MTGRRDLREVPHVRRVDVVVIGTGVAGLTAALAAAPRRVALLTKAMLETGSASAWARGGVAAALGPDDSPALHAADTVAVAGGMAELERVRLLAEAAPAAVRELEALGARFDRCTNGELALGREAAHSRDRIAHADGDATGREIVRALAAAVRLSEHIEVFEHTTVDELLGTPGRVAGVGGCNQAGSRFRIEAGAVVLATGGIGQLWRFTTNPTVATGDGLALALRAGARGRDLEMMQFHPTALAVAADPLPLLTEALRGAGAHLVDRSGQRFLAAEHELAELAPRDVIARAIAARIDLGEAVFLDAREALGAGFAERFPAAFEACRAAGVDPRYEPVPVVPAAHYHMGGVATDSDGRTDVGGLFAVGEVACAGVHGANRLASNSLVEGLVWGRRVAAALPPAGGSVTTTSRLPVLASLRPTGLASGRASGELRSRLRELVWRGLGIVRDATGIENLMVELEACRRAADVAGHEIAAMWTVAAAVAVAARARRESRGAHQRRDFPQAAPLARSTWTRWSEVERLLTRRGAGDAGVAAAAGVGGLA